MRKKPEWVLLGMHNLDGGVDVYAVSRSIYESYQENFSVESWGVKRASPIKLLAEGLTKEMAQNMARLTKELA